MNGLFAIAAQNTIVAVVLAIFVFVLTRHRRNPPLSHVLWLLVLIKLVAPPVMRFEWSAIKPVNFDFERATQADYGPLPRIDRAAGGVTHADNRYRSECKAIAGQYHEVCFLPLSLPALWNRA